MITFGKRHVILMFKKSPGSYENLHMPIVRLSDLSPFHWCLFAFFFFYVQHFVSITVDFSHAGKTKAFRHIPIAIWKPAGNICLKNSENYLLKKKKSGIISSLRAFRHSLSAGTLCFEFAPDINLSFYKHLLS